MPYLVRRDALSDDRCSTGRIQIHHRQLGSACLQVFIVQLTELRDVELWPHRRRSSKNREHSLGICQVADLLQLLDVDDTEGEQLSAVAAVARQVCQLRRL